MKEVERYKREGIKPQPPTNRANGKEKCLHNRESNDVDDDGIYHDD